MKKLIIILLFCPSLMAWPWFSKHIEPVAPPRIITIMLDPAGDPGRKIGNTYERGLSLQCAQEIKRAIELNNSDVRIIFARTAGEIRDQMEIASFANRLACDLFISIHFFKTSKKSPEYYIYRMMYDPQQDVFEKKADALNFLPYNQAYKLSINKSDTYARALHQALQSNPFKISTIHGIIALPLSPLSGIIRPALSIEIGIPQLSLLQTINGGLVQALQEILGTVRTS